MPASVNHAPAITVDVEDWPQSTWDHSLPITSRAADNTHRVLDLLSAMDVRATMFVLGRFAQSHPQVVRRMADEDHEVACHGYGHIAVTRLTRKQFQEDIHRAKSDLEAIVGLPVRGYRAPDFSIGIKNLWALDTLAEVGFEYDSSIFPVNTKRYGVPRWPVSPVKVLLANGYSLIEFPVSTYRFGGRNWPLGGGGYQRLLPGFVFRYLSGRVMAERPFILYCHPYEFDAAEFSNLEFRVPWSVRWHQGMGRRFIPSRFRTFLQRFGGCRIADLQERSWPEFRADAARLNHQPG